MTLQQQWGSVGMALALTTIVGVCGAGVAQTATSTTPPHVHDLTPAPRAQVTGDFTAGTTGQTADAIERVAIHDRAFAFTLNSPVMGHTDANGRVIGQLPSGDNVLSLTQVVLYDIAEMGEASLSRANLPTLAVYNGDTFLGTANYDTEATAAAQEVTVNLADGSTVTLRPVVYTFTEPIAVNAETPYELRLNAAGVTPMLPLFANATSDAGFGILNYEIWAPYVTFVCQGSVNVETFTVSEDSALSALGTYTDGASTALVFTLAEGVTLTLDKRVQNATLIFETTAPAASAPTVAFAENVAFSTPFVFRNAQGSDNGAIRVSGPWQDSPDKDSKTTWDPAALTVDCDLILASPLPFRDGNWFQGNKVRVLPGRTLRLETEANTPSRLPDVLLTAPTANLAFADTKKAAASAEKPSIPEKYLPLFTGTSGTITFERPVKLNKPTASQVPGEGSFIRIGAQGNENYQIALVMEDTFTTGLWRTHLGGVSGLATLELRNGTGSGVYGLCFEGNAVFSQWAGDFDMAVGAQWATEFIGSSATLLLGDGDSVNGAATTTMHGIKEGDGAADITVNSDATLLLDKIVSPFDKTQDDYALYPAGKRSLKVVGGTVRANAGDITMAFVNPEPQAAPMAVAEIPGIEIVDAAQLQAATGASLTIDTLKGDGTVSFDGNVTIGSALAQEGTTLTFDNYPLSEGAATLEAVSGTGTVIFGKLGNAGTTGVQKVADTLEAGNFTGTLSFLVKTGDATEELDYPKVDFAATDVPQLPYTLAVQPGQTLVMRLDQYVDADILWPENCSNVKLVLVEAGPFGGEATLPAWPKDVIFEFHRYDTANGVPGAADTHTNLKDIYQGSVFDSYEVFPNVNQGTVDLTWRDPVLSGKVAWIDMEFNGNSVNTGWLVLGDASHNGMLSGWSDAESQGAGELITASTAYGKPTHNPESQSLDSSYKAYIQESALTYPDQWSLVARVRAPKTENTTILSIGSNYQAGSTDGVLVLATGAQKDDRYDNDDATDQLVLWFIPNNVNADDMVALATTNVPCVTDSHHLYAILFDKGHVEVWLNGHRLIRTRLPAGKQIGPGLQIGQLPGGTNRNSAIIARVGDIGDWTSDDGCFDFLRLYRGVLSASALDELVSNYPYIHKEDAVTAGEERIRDVRYVRRVGGGTVNWVEDGTWFRQHKTVNGAWLPVYGIEYEGSAGGHFYAEPAEGAIVIIECSQDTEFRVNVTKHGQFPSADRTYAQLITRGRGISGTGKVTIKPCDDWETDTDADGNYTYGRLYFSGGVGDSVAKNESSSDTDEGGGSAAAHLFTAAEFYASVCDLSRGPVNYNDNRHLLMRADEARMRGEDGWIVDCKLTGPVSGSGYLDTSAGAISVEYNQESEFVFVPQFYPPTSDWLISDISNVEYGYNSSTSLSGDHPQTHDGLFARYTKYPGPLYLELNVDQLADGVGNLADQEWYSFGYNGDTAAETPSRIKPEKPKTEDAFEAASALYIRLKNGDTDDVLLVSANKEIANLTIDAPKGDEDGANESLRILPSSNGDRLTVTDSVTTARRLEVYDPEANGGAAGAGVDGIRLVPRTEIISDTTGGTATVIETGTLLHGVESGVYAAGNTSVNYPLDGSSIARIESVNTIAFAAAQDLSATTVAAAKNATVTQTNAADAFHAGAMELAEGSCFTFASEAASVDGAVTLTGDATLEGTGKEARLKPIAGIAGQAGLETTPTLTLDAAEGASWKLLNSEVGNLPLTKTGAGAADIATDLPPNAGKVDVQEGTLLVPTGIPGAGEAIGQGGLNVDEGATLAPTDATVTDDAVAEIPAGQTVSGLGSIAGQLRLNKGALLDATEAFADGDALHTLTVDTLTTDGATALADIDVALPKSTQPGLVFLRSNETTLNWDARARLLAKANGTRWDVFLKYRPDQTTAVGTNYLVDVAGLDVPTFPPDEEQPGEGENEWPDEDGDGSDTGDELGDQIQEGGNAAGGAEGYTMATTKRLTATDIAHVYDCFGSVWTYARRDNDRASEDYATIDLLMAYEFGISRMAFTQDGNHIVIEATLRNALADCPYFDPTLLQGAGALKPVFLPGVTVAIVGPKGVIADAKEIDADEAERNGFTPNVSDTETSRWFLVPYNDTDFPKGTATNLNVRAIPPAE